MPPKRATFYSYGDDAKCLETKKFIEDAGYILSVRDISKEKLTADELSRMIGYIDIKHFINSISAAYKKNKLDVELPSRNEILKMMEEDYTLIKIPIIRTTRLLTVGCNQKTIMEMLQITLAKEPEREVDGNIVGARSNGKSNNKNSGKPAARNSHNGKNGTKSAEKPAAASK